jgi:hypothetical protein
MVALAAAVRPVAVEPMTAKATDPFYRRRGDLGEEVFIGVNVASGGATGG